MKYENIEQVEEEMTRARRELKLVRELEETLIEKLIELEGLRQLYKAKGIFVH